MNIAEMYERSKHTFLNILQGNTKSKSERLSRNLLVGIVAILSLVSSFGLGLLAGSHEQGSVYAETLPFATSSSTSALLVTKAPILPKGGQVVASKGGSRYYLPWCGGVRRINDINKVWFSSAKSAAAAGYTPSKNCKGI